MAKRLPCVHRSWLERQQNCPICRASVFAQQPGASEQGAAAADADAVGLLAEHATYITAGHAHLHVAVIDRRTWMRGCEDG